MNNSYDTRDLYYYLYEEEYYPCPSNLATHFCVAILQNGRILTKSYGDIIDKDFHNKRLWMFEDCIKQMNQLHPGWEKKY